MLQNRHQRPVAGTSPHFQMAVTKWLEEDRRTPSNHMKNLQSVTCCTHPHSYKQASAMLYKILVCTIGEQGGCSKLT